MEMLFLIDISDGESRKGGAAFAWQRIYHLDISKIHHHPEHDITASTLIFLMTKHHVISDGYGIDI